MRVAAGVALNPHDDSLSSRSLQLTAGKLTLFFQEGGLRYLRVRGTEIVRGIYVAIRDHNWNTIPGRILDFRLESEAERFKITYRSEHIAGAVNFAWDAAITGASDGSVEFSMEGRARSSFKKNRIGFCLLHPMLVAGEPCTIRHLDGRLEPGTFPHDIAPHQPFLDLAGIEYRVGGIKASVAFEGEAFEMEDQRNWTDASFKTYCTPLERPFPLQVQEGERVSQKIVLHWEGREETLAPLLHSADCNVELWQMNASCDLPPIGLCLPGGGERVGATEKLRLAPLSLGHLRADLRFSDGGVLAALDLASECADKLGTGLELALHLAQRPQRDLESLIGALRGSRPPLARILVYKDGEKSCSGQWIALARRAFEAYDGSLPIGSGTDAFFAELNRERPTLHDLDFLCYSINPQVHAFDDDSLTETIPAQAETLRSARGFAGGKGVSVSPVTLRMRFNPNATRPEPEALPGEPPRSADPRQKNLYGAGWTAASLASLTANGAFSLTYYQTTGPLGLMPEGAAAVYPMYHVFADFGEFAGGRASLLESTDGPSVSGFVLSKAGMMSLFLVNHRESETRAHVRGLGGNGAIRALDAASALAATEDPEGFRSSFHPLALDSGIVLAAHAYLRIDLET